MVPIPGRGAEFDFIAGAPAGTDLITVVASEDSRSLTEDQAMQEVGPFNALLKTSSIFAKDLAVELTNKHGEDWSGKSIIVSIESGE